jgi:hypothetical protein
LNLVCPSNCCKNSVCIHGFLVVFYTFNDHLEDCEYRYSLINNVVQHTANESINTKFNEEDIHLSIGKLNTGKTSDGCTLTAEHFKYASKVAYGVQHQMPFDCLV